MMMDVDALSRRFGSFIAQHCAIAKLLHVIDRKNRSTAYEVHTFAARGQTKVKEAGDRKPSLCPLVITSTLSTMEVIPTTSSTLSLVESDTKTISSCPVLVTSSHAVASMPTNNKEPLFRMIDVQKLLSINCLCIDDVCGSMYEWCGKNETSNIQWNVSSLFSRKFTSLLFAALHSNATYTTIPINSINVWITESLLVYNLLETTFVPDNTMTLLQWLHIMLKILSDTIQNSIGMDRATLWISYHSYISHSTRNIEQEIDAHMPPDWAYHIHKYDCLQFGEVIKAHRVVIQLAPVYDEGNEYTASFKCNAGCIRQDDFAFAHKLQHILVLDHNSDAIELYRNILELDTHIEHSTMSPRVIRIISEEAPGKSILHTYKEQMIIDPMFPSLEREQFSVDHHFFGKIFSIPFKIQDGTWYARCISSH